MQTRLESKIKILATPAISSVIEDNFDEFAASLRDLQLPGVTSCDLQVLHEPRTEGFKVGVSVNVEFSTQSLPTVEALADVYACARKIAPACDGRLLDQNLGAVAIEQRTYGSKEGCAALVTSYYRWTDKNPESERERALVEHLEMEKSEPLYRSVHFNKVIASVGICPAPHDFIFEGYCVSRDDILAIYDKPALQAMRRHTEQFLDTSSRALAWGGIKKIHSLR